MKEIVIVFLAGISTVLTGNVMEDAAHTAVRLYQECSKECGVSICIKKRAITFLDRLDKLQNITLYGGMVLKRNDGVRVEAQIVTEKVDVPFPRAFEDKEDTLTVMLLEKVADFIGARTLQVALPKINSNEIVREARKGHFGGGGKKGKKGKKGGMMKMMMGMLGAKMMAMMGLKGVLGFFLAKKAIILSKIAILMAGMGLFSKLFSKMGGGKDGGKPGGIPGNWAGIQDGAGWHDVGGAGAGGHGGSHGGWYKRSQD